jgi:uncharacterized membrane protein
MSEPGASFWSRRRSLLLLMSLALNLLVIGAIAGTAIMHRRHGPPVEPVFGATGIGPGEIGGLMRQLPPERRRALRQALMAERPQLKSLRQNVFQARAELGRLIEAASVDRAALDAAAGRLWTAEGELRRAQLTIMGALMPLLTQQERAQFVAWRLSRRPGQLKTPIEDGEAMDGLPGAAADKPR